MPAASSLLTTVALCSGTKVGRGWPQIPSGQLEHELVVNPLAVPDLAALPSPDRLAEIASVTLLLQRTHRIDLEFRLDDSNAREIAEICVRLDGLPLAIELAAARMRVLPPRALLSRGGQLLSSGCDQWWSTCDT